MALKKNTMINLQVLLLFVYSQTFQKARDNMGEMKKVEMEYILRSSPGVLYSFLTEASGLSEWFCDKVNSRGNDYTFHWGGDSEQKATLVNSRENSMVRYHWEDSPPDTYFEFNLVVDDITSELALMVTDFAEPGDEDETILFWNNAIQRLHRVIGS